MKWNITNNLQFRFIMTFDILNDTDMYQKGLWYVDKQSRPGEIILTSRFDKAIQFRNSRDWRHTHVYQDNPNYKIRFVKI